MQAVSLRVELTLKITQPVSHIQEHSFPKQLFDLLSAISDRLVHLNDRVPPLCYFANN